MGSRGRTIEVGGSLQVLGTLYRVFQEERPLFCEVIVSVIVEWVQGEERLKLEEASKFLILYTGCFRRKGHYFVR
jgi:hypothetical protein